MTDDSKKVGADTVGPPALREVADLHVLTRGLAEQVGRTLRPHHEAMTRLLAPLGPVRSMADQFAQAMRPHQELVEHLRLQTAPLLGVTDMMNEAMRTHRDAAQRISDSLGPLLGVANQVAQAMRPYQDFVVQLNISTSPLFGLLEQINRTIRPALESGWLEAIQKGFQRFEEALGNAESMGRAGWTVPLNAEMAECIRLLREASSPESADLAFVEFYSRNDRVHLAELVADLLHRADLTEWQPLLEEIVFAVDAGKYRVAVPALLSTFEGVARRVWTEQFDNGPGRATFFDRKLKTLEPGSYDDVLWRAMKAFVGELYAQAREKRPLSLNRHWILHGREPASANLADCLRLLQAIHTAVELVEQEETPGEVVIEGA